MRQLHTYFNQLIPALFYQCKYFWNNEFKNPWSILSFAKYLAFGVWTSSLLQEPTIWVALTTQNFELEPLEVFARFRLVSNFTELEQPQYNKQAFSHNYVRSKVDCPLDVLWQCTINSA